VKLNHLTSKINEISLLEVVVLNFLSMLTCINVIVESQRGRERLTGVVIPAKACPQSAKQLQSLQAGRNLQHPGINAPQDPCSRPLVWLCRKLSLSIRAGGQG